MRREDLDLRNLGGLFAVVLIALSVVDLVVDGRIGARDVVLNVVAAAAVVGASLFPTFRLPGPGRRSRDGQGAGLTAAAVAATALAAVLVVAAVLG